MSFQERLENLRARPEHVRQRLAFWSAFGVTALIFAFWLASFTVVGNDAKSAIARAVSSAGSPTQTLVASVGGFFTDIKDIVFGPSKVVYPSVEVSPGK